MCDVSSVQRPEDYDAFVVGSAVYMFGDGETIMLQANVTTT